MKKKILHVWQMFCHNPKCKKQFHMFIEESKRPAEEVLCVACDQKEHKKGLLHYHYGSTKMFAGFNEEALEFTKRVQEIGE